jgi:hypothetical protein
MRYAAIMSLVSMGLAAFVLGAGCGDGDDEGTGAAGASTASGTGGGGGAGGGGLPEPICNPASKWTAGTQAFRDASADWGLDLMGVEGVRLAAVDFDGDGWVDLVVRRGGNGGDDFAEGGARQTWLLRNNGTGGFEDVTKPRGSARTARRPTRTRADRRGVRVCRRRQRRRSRRVHGLHGRPEEPAARDERAPAEQRRRHLRLGPAENALPRLAAEDRLPRARASSTSTATASSTSGSSQNTASTTSRSRTASTRATAPATSPTSPTRRDSRPRRGAPSPTSTRPSATPTPGRPACDLNGDGNAELLAASYGRAPNLLWQSGGPDGAFTSSTERRGGLRLRRAHDWSDNESARCWCKLHPDAETARASPRPVHRLHSRRGRLPLGSHVRPRALPPRRQQRRHLCADVDNDGDIDLVTGEIVHWDVGSLLRSGRAAAQQRRGRRALHRPGARSRASTCRSTKASTGTTAS